MQENNINKNNNDKASAQEKTWWQYFRANFVACCVVVFLLSSLAAGLVFGLSRYSADKTVLAATEATADSAELLNMALIMGGTDLDWPLARLKEAVEQMALNTGGLSETILAERQRDAALTAELASLVSSVANNKNLSDSAYEQLLISRLGQSIDSYSSKNVEILIFELKNEDLRGYMAKIKIKNNNALNITMASEDAASGETTSQAAKRAGAVFAVNGGGFAWGTIDGKQRLLPIGNTMIDGKLVMDFQPPFNDVIFIGFTRQSRLVGGTYETEEQLKASGAYQGVSFVPQLIHDWEPLKIPSQWANTKQPRTVTGQYPNGDIFFIVVDGRQSNWSSGISLEEMQVLLMRLGIMEAYNLDGGGSSAMYFNGKVLNKPSDGSERKLATNILIMP